jgi:hypothetical protein
VKRYFIQFADYYYYSCDYCVCRPFTVTPDNGFVPVGESIQINVEFKPTLVGDHSAELVLHYDTGDYIMT